MFIKYIIYTIVLTIFCATMFGMEHDHASAGREYDTHKVRELQFVQEYLRVERARPVRDKRLTIAFLLNASHDAASAASSKDDLSARDTPLPSAHGEFYKFSVERPAAYHCGCCGLPFRRKADYIKHVRAGHEGFMYRCKVCKNLFFHNQFQKHVCFNGLAGEEEHRFYCILCHKEYTKAGAFKEHVLGEHAELTDVPEIAGYQEIGRRLFVELAQSIFSSGSGSS
jgi:hypothetical protein